MTTLSACLRDLRACRLCAERMQRPPNPIVQASASARILIIGQAPGNLADTTGMPFNDPSGDRLRDWMSVSREEFYDQSKIAIMPMGFCFPGYDSKGSDLPPMKACSPVWHLRLLRLLPNISLTLLVGIYAQKYYLREKAARTLTETVQRWRDFAPGMIPLPHPSWRNTAWLKRNPWFDVEILPQLRASVRSHLVSVC